MARIRTIKPEFAGDEKMAKASRDARLTFLLVVSQADDAGLLAAAPRQILGVLYPLDETVTIEMLEAWLLELVAIGRIRWRETRDGARVIEVVNWLRHQRIDKVTPSKIAPLLIKLAESSREDREEVASGQRIEAEVGSGVGSRKLEAEKEVGVNSKSDIDISTSRGGKSNNPLSGESSNNGKSTNTWTEEFLCVFYATPGTRRQDIERQLKLLLTRQGVKLGKKDKAIIVWAADVQHLHETCAVVIAEESDPKRKLDDPDKAIVKLLKKLNESRLETESLRMKPDSTKRIASPGNQPQRIGESIGKVA